VNVSDNVFVGDIAGSTGTLTVTGAGTVLNLQGGGSNRLGVGNFGNGTLNITSGGVVNTQRLFTPREPGATSTITIDGVGSILHITTQLAVASIGAGNMTIQNGGQLNLDAGIGFTMGINAAGSGTLTVTGAGSAINAQAGFTIGAVASGSTSTLALVVQNGGTYTGGNSIFAAPNPGPTANISVTGTGSTLTTTGFLVLSGTAAAGAATPGTVGGTSSLTVGSGGAITATTTGTNLSIYAGGTVNINTGGTLSVTSIADGVAGSTGQVNIASGTVLNITDGNYLDSTSTSVGATFTGIIAGAGGVTKGGTGNQTLAGANTYSGGTTINGGTLTITNAGALGTGSVTVASGATLTGTGTIAIPAGATLKGTGTIGTAVSVAGTLHPGASPGILTAGGNVTFAATGSFAVDLNGTTAGNAANNYGQLLMTGTAPVLTLGGATLSPTLGYTPANGDKLFIIVQNDAAGTVVGTFGNAPGNSITLGSFKASISYAGDSISGATTGGNDVVLFNFTPVPEPAAVLGLATAAGVAFRLRRRFV
jgi:T5SS/PEP-CTERM-associated repeat protein